MFAYLGREKKISFSERGDMEFVPIERPLIRG
jgi:hypothetical protein